MRGDAVMCRICVNAIESSDDNYGNTVSGQQFPRLHGLGYLNSVLGLGTI